MAEVASALAARLRWARTEQAITLHQLSERCGRAVSYLSQLEHGVRGNPTKETIDSLAQALGVRPAFLFGEVPRPPFDDRSDLVVKGQAWSVGARFRSFWDGLSESQRDRYRWDEPGRRFGLVVEYLLTEMKAHFNRVELAWQLGMSLRQFDDILAGTVDISMIYLEQLGRITGVPIRFLTVGAMEGEAPGSTADQDEALRMTAYVRPFLMAKRKGISPEQLEAIIAGLRTKE